MPLAGEDGGSALVGSEFAEAAAANRYGGFLGQGQSANSYVVSAGSDVLVAAVFEGNYKDPRTVIAGCIVASELVQAVKTAVIDPEATLRAGLERAHQLRRLLRIQSD